MLRQYFCLFYDGRDKYKDTKDWTFEYKNEFNCTAFTNVV